MAEAEIKINPSSTTPQVVGHFNAEMVNNLLGLTYQSGDIFMYPGLVKHIHKQGHTEEWEKYHHLIPSMIQNPDYLGLNPKEQSVEYYKDGLYLLLAVKWDDDRQYFFVSTFYQLDNGEEKIKKRLRSGRIKEV